MVPLTSADKKLLKQITSFPWPADLSSPIAGRIEDADEGLLSDVLLSYAPLNHQLMAAAELHRRLEPQRIANVAAQRPDLSVAIRRQEFTSVQLLTGQASPRLRDGSPPSCAAGQRPSATKEQSES